MATKFSKETYLYWYELMLLLRRFEEKTGQLYGMQKIRGFCHLYIGQEAIAAGCMTATNSDDKFITAYRDHALAIRHRDGYLTHVVYNSSVYRDETGKVVMSRFMPETLQLLARDAAGFFFRSRADRPVYREVSERINRIAAASRWVMEPGEREPLYRYFLVAGLVFLLAETFIGRCGGSWR